MLMKYNFLLLRLLLLSTILSPRAFGLAAPVDDRPTTAMAKDGSGHFIRWREHIIDDSVVGGTKLSGSDGLAMADLDLDGNIDIVSVHESDTVYDGKATGHIRIAWGTPDPSVWKLSTLASGSDAAAAEDVSLADVNQDGYPDIVVACELAHLIYFENPGSQARTMSWPSVIPMITRNRGSFIRVFFADIDGDGRPEVIAANKGEQNPDPASPAHSNVSLFYLPRDALRGDLWREQVLTQVRIPINSQPVDLDQDGDLDIVAGSRGEARILWLENLGRGAFAEHSITTDNQPRKTSLTGFNMAFADLNGDERLDIISTAWPNHLLWLAAPSEPDMPWQTYLLGTLTPDQLVSVSLADIDGDGDLDAFTGSYSRGLRDRDDPSITVNQPLGRIAWFENPGINGAAKEWIRHDVSRRKRGMYDKWIARDMDTDGDIDFVGTRGNSEPFDGVIWLEQLRSRDAKPNLRGARERDSQRMALPQ